MTILDPGMIDETTGSNTNRTSALVYPEKCTHGASRPDLCGHCRLADARQVADALIKFDTIYANEIDPTPRPDWLVGALEAAQRLRAGVRPIRKETTGMTNETREEAIAEARRRSASTPREQQGRGTFDTSGGREGA